MGLERLLKTVTVSCEKNPLVERLCAAGLLAQTIQQHCVAGGVDPRKSASRADLLKAGVPLSSGTKSKASEPSKARGVFAYIHKHIAKGLSRRARRQEGHRLATEFFGLPKVEQDKWKSFERSQAEERGEEVRLDEDARYRDQIGGRLLHMSSRKEIFGIDSFRAAVEREVGVDVATQGMRNYTSILREQFRQGTIFDQSSTFTKETEVVRELQCGLAHPGLCAHDLGEETFEKAMDLHRKLEKYMKTQKLGDYICLTIQPANVEFYVVLGDIHGGSQHSVSVVMVQCTGAALRYLLDARGLVQPRQTSELAAQMLKHGPVTSVAARLCEVDHGLEGVEFISFGDAVEVLHFKAPRSTVVVERKDPAAVDIANGFNQLFRPAQPAQPRRRALTRFGERPRVPAARGPRAVAVESGESSSDGSSSSRSRGSDSVDASSVRSAGGDVVPDDAEVRPGGESSSQVGSEDYNSEYGADSEGVPYGMLDGMEGDLEDDSPGDGGDEGGGDEEGGDDDGGAVAAGDEVDEARPPKHRRRLDGWEVFDINTDELLGTIVWNEGARSLDAHCHKHGFDRLACHVNRTINQPRRGHGCGGRPLAFLLAWLHCARHYRDRNSHFNARLGRDGDAVHMTHEVRFRFRLRVEADPYWEEARGLERVPKPTEGFEPLGLP